jgi:catechol 2,3-dioxygenase-like lactoylglutathione lyase family enzyme
VSAVRSLRVAAAIAACAVLSVAEAQQSPESPVRGLYNWVHTTFDAEQTFAFYRDVLGIELAASPFLGRPNSAPEGIRSVAESRGDELVWNLTDTRGSRFRTVFMRAANTPFGLELSEFFDIPKSARTANAWDPGASRLIFRVRDLRAVMAKIEARHAPVVTLGGAPVATESGLAVLVRDPDQYLIELHQASAADIAAAEPGEVIATAIGIAVASLDSVEAFYGRLLGLPLQAPRRVAGDELGLYGLAGGEMSTTSTAIPGGPIVHFAAFSVPRGAVPPSPFRWRIQDLGAPQFQLEVVGLDALLERTSAAGYRFLSVGGKPIERPFGRFVFAIDGDGVLVEYVEPAAAR